MATRSIKDVVPRPRVPRSSGWGWVAHNGTFPVAPRLRPRPAAARRTVLPQGPAEPAVFVVVGEHRADPDLLLLLGADGRHYRYDLPAGITAPVEPGRDWVLDPNPPPAHELTA